MFCRLTLPARNRLIPPVRRCHPRICILDNHLQQYMVLAVRHRIRNEHPEAFFALFEGRLRLLAIGDVSDEAAYLDDLPGVVMAVAPMLNVK